MFAAMRRPTCAAHTLQYFTHSLDLIVRFELKPVGLRKCTAQYSIVRKRHLCRELIHKYCTHDRQAFFSALVLVRQ